MEERERIDIPELSNLNVEFFLSSNPDQIFINHHRLFINFSLENCIATFSSKFQNRNFHYWYKTKGKSRYYKTANKLAPNNFLQLF